MAKDARNAERLHGDWTGVEDIDATIDEMIEWLFEPAGVDSDGRQLYRVRRDIKRQGD